MFGFGFPEILIIGTVTLLVFGPKRLPELAQGLGKSIRGFKKAINGEPEDPTAVEAGKAIESKTQI